MSYFVYILKSEIDGSFYKGYTSNLEDRLKQHNSGKSTFTSRKCPWKLVCFEEMDSLEDAIKREKYFKSAAGLRYIKKLDL